MLTTQRPVRTLNKRTIRPVSEKEFPALQLARSSSRARFVARCLVVLLVITIPSLLLVPWQQTASGNGQVVAYAPLHRQQTVQAPIAGRISAWNERIMEGVRVAKGEMILELQDLDRMLLERLQQQEQATRRKMETARTKSEVYAAQVEAFREARDMAIKAADESVNAAEQKVLAEEQKLAEQSAAEVQEKLDFERQRQLYEKGLASGLEFQVAERKWREAAAKVKQAEAYVQAARNELEAKRAERIQKEREAQAKVDAARAYQQDAEGEIAVASKELADIQVKIARQESQKVYAPQDGFILRLLVNPGADMVKAGDPLFVLVPDAADRAVELYVDGNDLPLIERGRHVRLQFEGWPAVQFAGWPSVAVGTFGGEVALIDSTDDGYGRFRVLVTPAEGENWPSDLYLRQGVRANGWVLLGQVSLGYELWRQMNGFPPVAANPQRDDKDKPSGPKIKVKL